MLDDDTGEITDSSGMQYLDINKKDWTAILYFIGILQIVILFYGYYIVNQYQIGKGDDDHEESESDIEWRRTKNYTNLL